MQSDAASSSLRRASDLEVQGLREEAAQSYEEASRNQVNQGDFSRACDFLTKSVVQWEKAAYQAKTPADFSGRIDRARQLSAQALTLTERLDEPRKRMLVPYLKSMVMYFEGVLDVDQRARCAKFDECISLAKSSLSASEEFEDKLSIGRCCNQTMKCLFELSLMEVDASKAVARARAAPGYGEKAIASLLESGDEKELALAYFHAGFSHFSLLDILESEGEKAIARRRAAPYLNKALEISEGVGEKVVSANTLAVLGSLNEEWSEPVSFQRALELGKEAGDNLLISLALHLLASSTKWQIRGQEEEQKIRDLFRKELEYFGEIEKHCERFVGTWKEWIRSATHGAVSDDYRWIAEFVETDPNTKIDLLKKSIQLSNEGLVAPSTTGKILCLNALSRASHYLASITGDPEEKARLLDKALSSRLEAIAVQEALNPFYYWNRAVSYLGLALIQADLAEQSTGKERMEFYNESDRNASNGLEFFQKHLSEVGKFSPGQHAEIGRYLEGYSRIQKRLYELTADKKYVKKYTEVLDQAAENYYEAGIHSRSAEMHWRAAIMQSQAGLHIEAAGKFVLAGKKYSVASQRMRLFKTLYREYSHYMMVWSKIEWGRHYRLIGQHNDSRASYESAANMLLRTDKWRSIAPYYLAWSTLERAEALSVQDKMEEALKELAKATREFEEAGRLTTEFIRKEGLDESEVSSFRRESQIWKEYCRGRMRFEEARFLEARGERASSSTKFGEASEAMERLSAITTRSEDRSNLQGTALFYRGLQQLILAEDRSEPKLFSEAAEFFEKAMNESYDKRIRLGSAGNASLCRALEAFERFRKTRSLDVCSAAKLHLEAAADFFTEGGLDKALQWVKATRDLTDAHAYLISAQLTIDAQKKSDFFELSEKYLESSADQFRSVGNKSKADEISQLLRRIREEREFLGKPIEVPPPVSLVGNSAASLQMTGQEEAFGLKELEEANIQVQLTPTGEATVGQQSELRVDIVNIGSSTATLLRIEELVPASVEAEIISPGLSLEKGSIDFRARRIVPMKLEALRLRIRPIEAGSITFCPRLVYVTEKGGLRSEVTRPFVLAVQSPREFQFKSVKAKKIFDYLLNSFIEDHMKRKFFAEKAGWRTFMDVVKGAGVAKSSVYGVGGPGEVMMELVRRGLVEVREFPGERGRGGRVSRVRISYEKEPIRRFVDERILRK